MFHYFQIIYFKKEARSLKILKVKQLIVNNFIEVKTTIELCWASGS